MNELTVIQECYPTYSWVVRDQYGVVCRLPSAATRDQAVASALRAIATTTARAAT